MLSLQELMQAALVGAGATAVMDLWLALLRRLGVPTGSFAMVGRWAGHLAQGRLRHASIAKAPPVAGELALGWLVHYAVGMGFAAALVALAGTGWLAQPSFAPALLFGVATVAFPLLVMQPAMGAGLASRKTATPLANSLRSLANHAVFGCGLFGAAALVSFLNRS